MRMRKKKNLLPRMDACSSLLVADPRALRGRWRELLPDARELRVELGCGKGRFTAVPGSRGGPPRPPSRTCC